MTLHIEAQKFLRTCQRGILSTHSVKHTGYPFGSVAPFVLNHEGMPTILISNIAEHTKNITANPYVSLIVFTNEEDLQANARLTLLAEAISIDKNEPLMRARYLRYLPQAETYFDMHDFAFYTLKITHARYIAGFGKMSWIENTDMRAPQNSLAEVEADILAHMNADHHDSLLRYCQYVHQATAQNAQMIGIDAFGFDIHAQFLDGTKSLLRFSFDAPIVDVIEARTALITLAKKTKAYD